MPRGSIEVLPADLTKKKGLALVAERARDVDLLVNNAGFGTSGPLVDVDLKRMQREIRLNVTAVAVLTLAALDGMVARGSRMDLQRVVRRRVPARAEPHRLRSDQGVRDELHRGLARRAARLGRLGDRAVPGVDAHRVPIGEQHHWPEPRSPRLRVDDRRRSGDDRSRRHRHGTTRCRSPEPRTRRSSRRQACCRAASCAAWQASCSPLAEPFFLAAVRFASVGSGRFAPQSVLGAPGGALRRHRVYV